MQLSTSSAWPPAERDASFHRLLRKPVMFQRNVVEKLLHAAYDPNGRCPSEILRAWLEAYHIVSLEQGGLVGWTITGTLLV